MKRQAVQYLFIILIYSTAGGYLELHNDPLATSQKTITQTQQIFAEIAATKYILQHRMRNHAKGCNQQTYFDFTSGDIHLEFNNTIGRYDIVFYENGLIGVDTKYKSEKAPILQDLNNYWFQRHLQSDLYSTCSRSNSAYPASCKTVLTQKEFDTLMQAAEQIKPKLELY